MQPADDGDEERRTVPPAWLWLARLAIAWERLWPALWPAVFTAGIFLALALGDRLPDLPGPAHAAVLVAFVGAFAWTLRRAARSFRAPDSQAGRRRIERDSGLAHRPLSALEDELAGGRAHPAAIALWAAHRRRVAAQARRLRLGPPRAGLAARDPLALRALLILILVIAGAGVGDDWARRLGRAVVPRLTGLGAETPARLDLWLTPPGYTGLAPIVLNLETAAAENEAPLSVPEGSAVLAQVTGGADQPVLLAGEARVAFTEIEPGAWRAESSLEAGRWLRVDQGNRTLRRWPLEVLADLAPTIEFALPPSATTQGALRLEYRADDDYGVAAVRALIRRPDAPGASTTNATSDEAMALTLSPPHPDPRHGGGVGFHDLTAHPWAGLPVEIVLEATDARGQTTISEAVAVVLPERSFTHPVARAIVEQRRHLAAMPSARLAVARALDRIGMATETYAGDVVVMLSLGVAGRRLLTDARPRAVTEVEDLLWQTALRIEEGRTAEMGQRLRELQQQLEKALAGDASQAEIERLMSELQSALDEYLAALAEQARRQASRQELTPFDPDKALAIRRDELQHLLDRARDMAALGARDAARDLLAQLQDLLENLRASATGGAGSGQAQAAQDLLRDLNGLTSQQQGLLDRGFRRAQELPPETPETSKTDQEAASQETLRRDLGDVMRRFGEILGDIPAPLGRAERAMREAVEALRQGQPDAAVDPQSRALSQLQEGAAAALEALRQSLGQGDGHEELPNQFGHRGDPLGRDQTGMGALAAGNVRIPEQAEIQRAREILDELRHRLGDRARPQSERDYIERLLPKY